MKREIFCIILIIFICLQAGALFADTKTFTMTATMSPLSGVNVDVFKVRWMGMESVSTNVLNFDLAFNGRTYNSDYFFLLSVKPIGSGDMTTVVTYTEGQKPAGAVKGLGDVCIINFYKGDPTTGAPGGEGISGGGVLGDLKVTITPDQIRGGILNIHLALNSREWAGPTFTLNDAPGLYDGILTITLTVL